MHLYQFFLIAAVLLSVSACDKDQHDLSKDYYEHLINEIGSNVNLKKDLIAYWPFAGNADDASGNKHHGLVQGPSLTTDRKGKKNAAYYFDGINYSKILVSNDAGLNLTEDFTISCWFNLKGTFAEGTIRTILSKVGDGLGTLDGYIFGLWAGDEQTGMVNFQAMPFHSADTYPSGTSGFVQRNKWYNYTATYSKKTSQLRYYLNGKLIDIKLLTFTIGQNSNPFVIGTQLSIYNTVKTFHGSLDEIRIYNRVLNSREIQSLFDF